MMGRSLRCAFMVVLPPFYYFLGNVPHENYTGLPFFVSSVFTKKVSICHVFVKQIYEKCKEGAMLVCIYFIITLLASVLYYIIHIQATLSTANDSSTLKWACSF